MEETYEVSRQKLVEIVIMQVKFSFRNVDLRSLAAALLKPLYANETEIYSPHGYASGC